MNIVPSLQSIGFVGPGIALVGLVTAKSPAVASAWLTLAVGLKSFSHSGFLVNLQVGIVNVVKVNSLLVVSTQIDSLFVWCDLIIMFLLPGDRSTVLWCFTWYVKLEFSILTY